ncbi:hypothetical protein O181_122662 [Austropuccinia psidii MF-1]|uniref:Uncharacterized protein n=1 Tax=Austropuccinia psidii MF-1 TaxID=1389203 RepID=A0A9Q3KNJ1_9BASI|nr:hypothetical protein [Austropuccinia psidii MF-1]
MAQTPGNSTEFNERPTSAPESGSEISPGRISQQLSAIDFMSHRDETPTLPPISVLTTPYAFTPPPLPSLCSHGALPTCSQHHLSLHSRSALLTCSQHHLSLRLCSALPTLLTIPTLQSALPTFSQHHISLRLCSALPTSSRHCLPSLRSQRALLTQLILTLAECTPNISRNYLSLGSQSASQHSLDTT